MYQLFRPALATLAFFAFTTGTGTAIAASTTTEANIAKVLQPILKVQIEHVEKTKFSGLYEVLTPQGIFYSDAQATFFIPGPIISTNEQENLTEKRLNELGKFDFSSLNLADAVKTVRGNGKRVLATVEDPNCSYCKRLAPELQKLDNVTIYTFIIPILGPDSTTKANEIWCSGDPQSAWMAWMNKNTPPAAASTVCATPFERNVAMSGRLRVRGTPAILFKDGTRIPGYATADTIEKHLSQ